ncbi:MAG: response regulator [bacterium]|nr:MAG: response regulator [bacterium]
MIAKPRVLVIDDEPVVVKSCDRVLVENGIEVEGVTSGRDGLDRAESTRFDAILLDLKMPDMNGMEVLRRIKQARPEVTVIIITGFPSVDTAIEAFKLGVFDYVPKPFTPDELVGTVKRAFELQKPAKTIEPTPTDKVMKRLLEALEACGKIAAFYKGQNILMANNLFADLFERDIEECRGLSILEICHEESIDMIRDYIHRREFGDHNVPSTYVASFTTPRNIRLDLVITVVKTRNTDGALLGIFQEKV